MNLCNMCFVFVFCLFLIVLMFVVYILKMVLLSNYLFLLCASQHSLKQFDYILKYSTNTKRTIANNQIFTHLFLGYSNFRFVNI